MSILDNNKQLTATVAEIAEVAGYLWNKGWAERNGGNISVNITSILTTGEMSLPALQTTLLPHVLASLEGQFFFVTGTGKRMRDLARSPMENAAIIRVLPHGVAYDIIADNVVTPTSELFSHLAIHDHFNAVKDRRKLVVLHTHPTELVALTHHRRLLRQGELTRLLWSMIPETRVVVPRGIGIVPYELPGSVALAEATIDALEHHDVVAWEKHGALVVDENIFDAFDIIDTLVKSAAIYLNANALGREPEGLSDEQLEALCSAFNLPRD
ncbi:MAG: rhamnulose-1-phosphate aldolase [Odoribacteraceae bacterium]|jgi:rhamnulose-1-phosphate aldolase|nr:rhamnulose-1-phosphate aldolase [Odoribacteraceae bacterium]